jgi:hypothetical protein
MVELLNKKLMINVIETLTVVWFLHSDVVQMELLPDKVILMNVLLKLAITQNLDVVVMEIPTKNLLMINVVKFPPMVVVQMVKLSNKTLKELIVEVVQPLFTVVELPLMVVVLINKPPNLMKMEPIVDVKIPLSVVVKMVLLLNIIKLEIIVDVNTLNSVVVLMN